VCKGGKRLGLGEGGGFGCGEEDRKLGEEKLRWKWRSDTMTNDRGGQARLSLLWSVVSRQRSSVTDTASSPLS
jgi:hypothetical protein